MPAGPRIRTNNVFGLVADNPLPAAGVSLNSAGLSNLPSVAAQHAVITLDPLRVNGTPEIIVVTGHTTLSTVATISRGAYGTTARAHPQGTLWTHTPMNEDFTQILTSTTRPSDPFRGETIFETDTNRYVGRSTADIWQQAGLFFDPPACRINHNTTQSMTSDTDTIVTFNSERYDTASMHDLVVTPTRITIPIAGLYLLSFSGELVSANDYQQVYMYFRLNGTTAIGVGQTGSKTGGGSGFEINGTTVWKFAVSDYVEVFVRQTNSLSQNRNLTSVTNYTPEFSATWIGRGN